MSKCECFTDSTIVLHWIQGTDKNWKSFVQHRVLEIREKIGEQFWNHCRGEENPSDLPLRGTTLRELQKMPEWLHGPTWLKGVKRDFFNPDTALPPECLEELRSCDRNALAFAVFEKREKSFGEVIDINRFSTYEKLIKNTAYLFF